VFDGGYFFSNLDCHMVVVLVQCLVHLAYYRIYIMHPRHNYLVGM
jgi:hypothetical protein